MPQTKLLYQGHSSYRITTGQGTVIYVDPYEGEGYDLPADLILITHQHVDHNQIQKVTQKDDCTIITNVEALAEGKHQTFCLKGINIEAVMAANSNHNPSECVGYLIGIDDVLIYFSGDTSKTEQMQSLAARKIDYAFLPCDGVYNMDLAEAAECADLIQARHTIPVHLLPGSLFSQERAEAFQHPSRLIVKDGEEIELSKA